MRTIMSYEQLQQFMPWEDWRDYHEDLCSFVRDRISGMPPIHLKRLVDEIDAIFDEFTSAQRRSIFDLRNEFSAEGVDFDMWLRDIRKLAFLELLENDKARLRTNTANAPEASTQT